MKRFRIYRTWDGNKDIYPGVLLCTLNEDELMPWFHRNTPFSMDEAVKHQGYKLVEVDENNKPIG